MRGFHLVIVCSPVCQQHTSSGVARVGVIWGGNRSAKKFSRRMTSYAFSKKTFIYPGQIFNDFLAFHTENFIYSPKIKIILQMMILFPQN